MDTLKAAGGDWEFYFWTGNKTLIPRTVKWMEELGYVVRKFHELPSYDETFKEIVDDFTAGNIKSAGAADIIR